MSWGERSCANKPCPIPDKCTMNTCNAACPSYRWDGHTPVDSHGNAARAVEKIQEQTTKDLMVQTLLKSNPKIKQDTIGFCKEHDIPSQFIEPLFEYGYDAVKRHPEASKLSSKQRRNFIHLAMLDGWRGMVDEFSNDFIKLDTYLLTLHPPIAELLKGRKTK